MQDALVSVTENGNEADTGYTDASGQITFSGCGMDVEIIAVKQGMEGFEDRHITCAPCAECVRDGDCNGQQACVGGRCTVVECACGSVLQHRCENYACCADADCGQDRICQNHSCIKTYDCGSDSDCSDSQYCNRAAGAAKGYCTDLTGECGQAQNHAWVKYACGSEPGCDACPRGSNCADHVCVPQLSIYAPDTAIVGQGVNVTVLEGTGRCRNCQVSWTSPAGRTGTGKTDANGNLLIPLNEKGKYRIVLVKDPAKAATVNSVPKPAQPVAGQPVGILDAFVPYMPWLMLLLLIIIGTAIYLRRRSAGGKGGGKPASKKEK
jgi:hypothetical protein